jgi:hypothetical protein
VAGTRRLESFITAAAVALGSAAAAWSAWVLLGPAAPPAGEDPTPVFVQPARRSSDLPPVVIPELPAGADEIAPLTLRVRIRARRVDGGERSIRQTVSRASDRVHVLTTDGPEWYFERNPRDGRRASGFLIDHGSRTVVSHSESELRSELGIAGWAQVLTLGVDPGVLTGREPSRETRSIDGVVFAQYRPAAATHSPSEVWWSGQHLLPGDLTVRDDTGVVRLTVEAISPRVDIDLLQPPELRFPAYRHVDLADWREAH